MPDPFTHIYRWGNNPQRKKWKGLRCRQLARGTMNSCLVEFETGVMAIISRNAIRKIGGESCT